MEQIRELQLTELEILKEFIRLCEIYNLKYYAIGGTVLGAVRHRGFIPWDDDVDVSMPREDYEKFLKIASENLEYPYEIRTINNDENHICPFMKIIDRRVQIFVTTAKEKVSSYAYIDVFPADGLPASRVLRYFHVRLFLFRKALFYLSVFDKNINQNKKRKLHEKFIINFCNLINVSRFLNKKKRILAGDKLLKKYVFGKTKYCSPQLWGQYKFKAVFPVEWFGDGVFLTFENMQILAPANYEKYLEQLYGGDYMQLPPEEKRITHASQVVFNNKEDDNEKI